MNKKYTKGYADKILDQLIDLDVTTNAAYYDMGRLLSAISKNTLWDIMGYDSFSNMIEEELSFTSSTAGHYIRLYDNLRRLKYNKVESLALIQEHSMTRLCDVLPGLGAKIGTRAIGTKIKNLDHIQVNYTVTTAELKEVEQALVKLGATRNSSGRFQHSSEAFMSMIRDVNKKPAMKAVA